jgi:hypothetical protein
MKKIAFLLFIASLLFFTNAFGANTDDTLYKKTIETGKASEIKTDISFVAGELHIKGTDKNLAQCFYGYKHDFIRPIMKYHEVGKTGYLSIESESLRKKDLEDISDKNEWNLLLNNEISNAVAIELKAGEAHIDMEGCNLSRFEYRMLAGESNIILRNTSVPSLYLSVVAGEANVDLSGKWKNDLNANIKGGVGELKIKLPYDVGIRITASGILGEINIPFFNKDGRTYTNDLYGKTKNTLYIDINGGIGEISIEMVE